MSRFPVALVVRIPLKVCSARGRKLLPGSNVVLEQAHDRLGVRDSLSLVDEHGRVSSVVVNSTDFDKDVEEYDEVEAQVAGIVSQLDNKPCEPERGPSRNSLSHCIT